MSIESATRASDLLDTFGVATHITFTDGVYASIGDVLKSLAYLGVDHVRDRAPNPTSALVGQKHLAEAADAGIHFVFHPLAKEDPATVVRNIHAFEDIHPGSVKAIEGLNEVDNFKVAYKGLTGTAAAQSFQKDYFAAVNADPLLRSIPVLGFTSYPAEASASDWSNTHFYATNGDQPYKSISGTKALLQSIDSGKPFAITEIGYHNSLGADSAGGWEGVDRLTQAKLTLNAYMDAAENGSRGTYLYQLLDAPSDGSGTDQENNFGLFDSNYRPKPVATAIHNLTSILQDDDSAASSFSAGTLSYVATGLPANGHDFLTQKTDGSFQIVFWAEPDIWDQAADKPISVQEQVVTLKFDEAIQQIEIFDPMIGTSAIRTISNTDSITFAISDHPIVIDIHDVDRSAPGMGDDTYVVDAPRIINEATGGGTDTIRTSLSQYTLSANFENLTFTGASSFKGTGNGAANVLTGGAYADVLDGRVGADQLSGKAGNDTYYVDNIGDAIIEAAAQGKDKVYSSVDYRLGANVEDMTLTGGAHLDAYGNAASNQLAGNTGNNRLSGGPGSDRLIGRQGNDTFLFDAALGKSNIDTVVDFSRKTGDYDKISLDHQVFTAVANTGVLRLAAFAANSTGFATQTDDRIIYETDTGNLYYDADGSKIGDRIQFAKLSAGLDLVYSDFLVF